MVQGILHRLIYNFRNMCIFDQKSLEAAEAQRFNFFVDNSLRKRHKHDQFSFDSFDSVFESQKVLLRLAFLS